MSKKSTVKPASTSQAAPGLAKIGTAERAARRAEAHQGRVAQRAYALYEQRGCRDGGSLEDWLNAEQQLLGLAMQDLA
jgi:hypothetical protein